MKMICSCVSVRKNMLEEWRYFVCKKLHVEGKRACCGKKWQDDRLFAEETTYLARFAGI